MLFIGGTGGSGTRLISLFSKKAGYYIGTDTNESLDAMCLESFYRKYTYQYLENTVDIEEMRKELVSSVNKHIGKSTNPYQSIKNPRSLLILPFLHSVYPNMKYIHIVRSGRSMSFSGNRRHVRKYGDIFAKDSGINTNSWSPQLAMKMWAETNLQAYSYGKKHMGNNYLLIRYEDLCSEKRSEYKKIVNMLGCSKDMIPKLTRKARIPETWKRGRKQNKELIAELEEIGQEAIKCFGYNFVYLNE